MNACTNYSCLIDLPYECAMTSKSSSSSKCVVLRYRIDPGTPKSRGRPRGFLVWSCSASSSFPESDDKPEDDDELDEDEDSTNFLLGRLAMTGDEDPVDPLSSST